MIFAQSNSYLSKWSLSDNYSSEFPLSSKTKLIQNYNLKIKQVLKNDSKIQKQALDSLYIMQIDTNNPAIGSEKYTFAYDALGRQTGVTTYDKNSPSAIWNKSTKEVFIYDALGNLITDIVFKWNYVLNKWLEFQKWEYTYNSSGLIIQSIQSTWNSGSHIWVKHDRADYTYDAALNLIQINYFLWDKPASQWSMDCKRDISYISGKIFQRVDYIKNSQNQIFPLHKTTYDYYSNDSLKSVVGQSFHFDSTLFYTQKAKFIYDTNNDNILRLEYEYNHTQNSWDTVHKTIKTFFTNHHVSSSIYFSKDTLNLWYPQGKAIYTEDNQGIVIDISNYCWKAIYGIWIPVKHSGFYLDNSTPYSSLILPMEYEGDYIKGKIDHIKQYDYNPWTVSWRYLRRYQYFFTLHIVGLSANTNDNEGVVIYPNPSSGKFSISLPEDLQEANVSVTNISGKEIFQRKVQRTNSIEVELNVPPGLYFVHIMESSGTNEVFKIVLK